MSTASLMPIQDGVQLRWRDQGPVREWLPVAILVVACAGALIGPVLLGVALGLPTSWTAATLIGSYVLGVPMAAWFGQRLADRMAQREWRITVVRGVLSNDLGPTPRLEIPLTDVVFVERSPTDLWLTRLSGQRTCVPLPPDGPHVQSLLQVIETQLAIAQEGLRVGTQLPAQLEAARRTRGPG